MDIGIIIGIDAGTSVLKLVAFSCDGRQLAVAAISNDYVTFPDGGVEQDMNSTWADAVKTFQPLGEKIPDLASRLIAISVTAQGDGMWLIDRDGAHLKSAMSRTFHWCCTVHRACPKRKCELRRQRACTS